MRIAGIMLLAVTIITISAPLAHADLKTLMKLGKSQEEMAKALRDETKNYEKTKDAILNCQLREGMTGDEILKKCGEPIFDNVYDRKRNAYKWLYMPATSSHFSGEKLYLFVDNENILVGWKIVGLPEDEEGEE